MSRRTELIQKTKGRKGRNRVGPPVAEPRAIEARYQAELKRFVKELSAKIEEILIPNLANLSGQHEQQIHGDSWESAIDALIKAVSVFGKSRMERLVAGLSAKGQDVAEFNKRSWARSMKAVLGVDIFDIQGVDGEWLLSELSSWARENASLITSIQDDMLGQVEGIVQRGVRSGENVSDIASKIRERFGVSESRAKLIGRDQVAKLNGQITQSRNQRLGIDKYIWSTSKDQRVRGSRNKAPRGDWHDVMDGKLCRWDDPTVYSDDGGETWLKRSRIGGVQQHPGQDIQCRCISRPYLSDIIKEWGDKK